MSRHSSSFEQRRTRVLVVLTSKSRTTRDLDTFLRRLVVSARILYIVVVTVVLKPVLPLLVCPLLTFVRPSSVQTMAHSIKTVEVFPRYMLSATTGV